MALYNITSKQEFEEKVLKNKKVVLVDFWAEWCPPCRAMAPILHDISEENDDLIDIVKVDIEANQENNMLASEYGVMSIPNMPMFLHGKEKERLVGTTSKSNVVALAKSIIAKHTKS